MPRHHRFGRADIRQKAREDIARNVEEANDQYRRYADMSLSNKGLMADRLVLEAQEGRREIDERVVSDEILSEKGKNLAAGSLYAASNLIFQLLLPTGVNANEEMNFNEHLVNPRFQTGDGSTGLKQRRKKLMISRSMFAHPLPLHMVDPARYGDDFGSTPDKMNNLGGFITLDQRVMAQLSIGASVVVQDIIDAVPSHEVPDVTNNYTTKRVIYVEDLVDYIHANFSQNITLDPDTNDAFDRLSKGALSNFTRGLLRKFSVAASNIIGDEEHGSVYFNERDAIEGEPMGETVYDVGKYPSVFKHIYFSRLHSMCSVSKENVGKVWQSKTKSTSLKSDKTPYNAIWMSVASMLRGNARTVFGTKFNMRKDELSMQAGTQNVTERKEDGVSSYFENGADVERYDAVFDLVCSVMSLIAIHVMSYALSYAIDAYIRLAIRGAERVDGKIVFNHENVITPQIIFPGIKSALEMYGVSSSTWDKEVAFHLSTNKALMELFLEAKRTYDVDNSKPGVKRFSNPIAEDPYWTQDRSSQSARNADWEEKKGNFNQQVEKAPTGSSGRVNLTDLYRADRTSQIMDARKVADGIANSVASLRRHAGQEQMLRERAGAGRSIDIVGAAFGRSRRGSKRRHSSKNKSRKASFGKKRASKSRGSKKRRGSKKH